MTPPFSYGFSMILSWPRGPVRLVWNTARELNTDRGTGDCQSWMSRSKGEAALGMKVVFFQRIPWLIVVFLEMIWVCLKMLCTPKPNG